MLDQTDDSSQNNETYEHLSKSVLTPNMYRVSSKRGNTDNIISTNPYIKFKKDKTDTASVQSATFRNGKQSNSSSKPKQAHATTSNFGKLMGELSQ